MKNLAKMVETADDDILDDLISACESKMGSKFKKEPKEDAVEITVESEPEGTMSDDEDEMDPEKMAMMIAAYKEKLKAKG